MTQRSYVGVCILALLAACSSATPPAAATTEPAPTAERLVQDFMRAVSDSNLAKMAQLWGSAKGSAAQTHEPSDYERRIVIMQAYLRAAQFRILSNDADPALPARRVLQVELKREQCVKIIPFTVVPSGSGWLVNQIDLSAAGSPGRPCGASSPTSP